MYRSPATKSLHPGATPSSAQRAFKVLAPKHLGRRGRIALQCDAQAYWDPSTTSSRSIGSAEQVADQSRCPFHQLTGAIASPARDDLPRDEVPIPGPAALSLESLADVASIFLDGLHAAQLRYSNNYGSICRFANPTSLNGATSWVFINSPDLIQHVCATNVQNYKRRYLPDIYKFVTHEKGILGSQDDYNARHRRLCAPSFRNKNQLQRFASVVVDRALKLADIWRSSGTFQTDVAVQTQRLTLDIVGLVAFSHDFGQVERIRRDLEGTAAVGAAEEHDRLLWAVNTFGEVLAQVFITPLQLLQVMDRIGFPQLKLLSTAIDTIKASMLDVIQERRMQHTAAIAAGNSGGAGRGDLLDSLLQAVDDQGQHMTDEELWEDVHDIMGAGHETTATTTAAVLYCISAHPDVEARVAAELEEVLGGRAPTYDDLERLQYLGQCVRETMRLYPAIPIFPREAQAEDILPTGHKISAGDVVFMSSYALGREQRVWPEPLKYDPDRFSAEREAQQHRFQFLPFGAGPRMCLGSTFAQMSVTLMAATLLQSFQFKPIKPTESLLPVQYDITMNFNTTQGLHMLVSGRQRAAVTAKA